VLCANCIFRCLLLQIETALTEGSVKAGANIASFYPEPSHIKIELLPINLIKLCSWAFFISSLDGGAIQFLHRPGA
jgi:hypothetical protein